ncbi:MAG: hypothetical protein WCA29_00570 [Jiangellales bacterium]
MLTKAVLAATAMAVVAACGSSTDDDAAAEPTPDQTSAETSAAATAPAVEGTLCSEVGVASEDPPPEESEGFDGITIYIVEQPVDDTLVVDPGAGCAIRSTVSGDLVVNAGGRALALVNPGGVIKGDIRVSGLGRVAGLEDREELSDELGPPTLEGDLLCDECGGAFAIPGTIEGSVDIVGTPTGGQTEFNGATIGGDVSIVASSGTGQLDEEWTGPLLANSDVAGSVTLNDSFGRSPVLDGTTIGGDVSCEGNSPEPIGTDVTVEGTASGQCEGFGE